VIVAEGIIKKYGNLEVLKGVNIHISEGEVVAIVGKSGAGKSTLLHILGTLDRADSGSLLFKGTDVNKLNNTDLSKFRNSTIGFVFQFHYLLPEFTALENVCIPGYIANKQENEVIKEGKKWLDYLGLSERMNHKPGSLSGGEQQRVSVARALINRPAIIFADEPSGNLDIQTSQELHSLIFTLRKDFNQTFVLVTHNMDLAKMSDRCLEMRDGIILD
jgi:lipoprotein-releasing system ATP-binding protein